MTAPLSPGQEAFVQALVRGVPRIEAALAAFPALGANSKRPPREAASERARQLLKLAPVRDRLAELQANPAAAATGQSPESAQPTLADLERLGLIAFDAGEPDVMRLLALRAITAGLLAHQRRLCEDGRAARIEVRIALDGE